MFVAKVDACGSRAVIQLIETRLDVILVSRITQVRVDLSGVDKRVSFQLADERRELRFEGRERGGGRGGEVVVCVRACLCDLFTSGASVVRGEEVAVISVSELRVPISFWTNGGTRWTRIRGDASLVSLPEFPDG